MPSTTAKLWIVATPIGNIADLSPRAKSVLENADLILAEDTRRAGKLFAEAGVKPPPMWSFFEHNEKERQAAVLEALAAGKTVALITDAGTPLVADPGFRLVRACRKEGFPVSAIPGPSAALAALSASGVAPIPFTFLGFMPRSRADREALFLAFAQLSTTLVFFERKNRLGETLAIARDILGARELVICRELTKIHEEFIRGNLVDGPELATGLLGEITVVIGPPLSTAKSSPEEVLKLLEEALNTDTKPRDAARKVRDLVHGWSMGELYSLATRKKERDGE